jgi:putative two-component system response regulator
LQHLLRNVGNEGRADLISADRAEELGLTEFLAAIASGEPDAAQDAMKSLADSARARISVSAQHSDPDWFERVTNLLMRVEDKYGADYRIDCLLSCAQWFQKEGQAPLGIAAAEKAVELAEGHANFSLLRRAYSVLGNLHNTSKDYVQATVCYARAVEIARSIGDKTGECAGIANLAAARFNSGLLEESRTLNSLVIEMAAPLEKQDSRLTAIKQQAHANIALASLMLGDLFIGRTNIENAIGRGPEPINQLEALQRVVIEYTYVRILSKAGEYDTARERAVAARSYAQMANSKPADIQASLAESACDLNEGRFDIGLSRLQRLLQEARNSEIFKRDVLEALVVGHDRAGHKHEARRLHKEYLEALSHVQRKAARQQLDNLKRSFKLSRVSAEQEQPSVLPDIVVERLRQRDAELWKTFRARLEAMAVLAELRDDATGEHAFRVGRLSALFAKALGHAEQEIEEIELAARLHDIGKLVVPDLVLQKRGRLIDVELEVMRRHAAEGASILQEIQHAAFQPAAEIALSHHEWWNGQGYPRGLEGEAIPKIARITALADVFDALSHKRPYKPSWPFDRCVNAIRELSGKQFEPGLCNRFLELVTDLRMQHGDDLDGFLGAEARRSPIVNANRMIDRLIQEHRAGLL